MLVPYLALVAATAVERLTELVISRRNAAALARFGAVEYGRRQMLPMVLLHVGFLGGAAVEPIVLARAFEPGLAVAMVLVVAAAHGLRWWSIATLGPRWNTRVIVVPGIPRATDGPYRYFAHPNYVGVFLEGIALPLIHGAWITAAAFTILNAPFLAARIRCEERALSYAEARS